MLLKGDVWVRLDQGNHSDMHGGLQPVHIASEDCAICAVFSGEGKEFIEEVIVDPDRGVLSDSTRHQLVHGLLGLMGVAPSCLEVRLECVPGGEVSWDQGNVHAGKLGFAPGASVTLQLL